MPINGIWLILLVFLLAVSFYFFYQKIENFFIFYPDRSIETVPANWGLNYEDVSFEAGDGTRLHGWFFPLPGKGPTILFCHGNAGNISHRIENVKLLLDYGLQVFLYDYRGYGSSGGRPSEAGLYQDGLAAYDYLVERKNILPDRIIPFGRSLGAAVAMEIATKRDVRSLIIESAFTSTKDMAKSMFLFQLLSPFLPPHYNNLRKIKGITVPRLIIHGETDEIVPFSMGQMLYRAASVPKYFFPIHGAGHNDTYFVGGKRYFQIFSDFAKNSRIEAYDSPESGKRNH
jgi:fermentation-respiration switch protein FrsA (DUF1100 family)